MGSIADVFKLNRKIARREPMKRGEITTASRICRAHDGTCPNGGMAFSHEELTSRDWVQLPEDFETRLLDNGIEMEAMHGRCHLRKVESQIEFSWRGRLPTELSDADKIVQFFQWNIGKPTMSPANEQNPGRITTETASA